MEKKESKLFMTKKEKKQSVYNEARLIKKSCDHKVGESYAVEVMNKESLMVKCKLCGETFSIKAKSEAEVHQLCKGVIDVINCIKLKGEYGSSDCLPTETRRQLGATQMLLESLTTFYKNYYLDNLEGDRYESNNRYAANGPCEISSDGGGLLLGNASNWNKKKKHRDIDDLLGEDRYRGNKNKNKNKNKKHDNDRW